MSFRLQATTPRRGIGLTPMIDVVFLLLVFFMLAATFDRPVLIELAAPDGAAAGDAPRLVDIVADGLRLNGVPTDSGTLADALANLGARESVTVLRPQEGVTLQRLVDVVETLRAAGFSSIAVIE